MFFAKKKTNKPNKKTTNKKTQKEQKNQQKKRITEFWLAFLLLDVELT